MENGVAFLNCCLLFNALIFVWLKFSDFLSQLCTNVLSKPPISHFKSNSDDIDVTRLRLCVVALYTFCAHTELFFLRVMNLPSPM